MADLKAPVLTIGSEPIEHLNKYSQDELTLYTKYKIEKQDEYLIIIDGCAIAGSKLVKRASELPTVFLETLREEGLDAASQWWGSNSKNPNALYLFDTKNNEVTICPDPLGACIIFMYEDKTHKILSTCISSLVYIADELGITLTKSETFQIQRIVFGNGGYNCTPFKEVSKNEPFEYIKISNNQILNKRYDVLDRLSRAYSYVRGINSVIEDIASTVNAVAGSDISTKIAHITGGFDSRLLLSAILHSSKTHEFYFFCSGPSGTLDRIIADAVTEKFGLNRTRAAGLSAGPTKNIAEQLLGSLFYSQGIASTGPNGRENETDLLAVGGGYGGLLRSTFGSRMAHLDGDASGREIFAALEPYYNHTESIISDGTLASLQRDLEVEWKKLAKYYAPSTELGDALYLHIRNRFHFGFNAMQWSRIGARVDPLYSVDGYFLSLTSTRDVRESNIIGFDILNYFNDELINIPFDHQKFHGPHFSTARRFTVNQNMPKWASEHYVDLETPSHNDSSIIPAVFHHIIKPQIQVTASDRKRDVESANKIGVNYWQISQMPPAQRLLKSMLQERPELDQKSGLRPDYVDFLAHSQLHKRKDIRNLYTVIGHLAWLFLQDL